MAYDFAANADFTWTDSASTYGATGKSNLICGWFYPTTLTAGRCLWGVGGTNRCAIATTTSEIDLFLDRTTDSQHTTSGLNLTVDEWKFIAVLGAFADLFTTTTYKVWAASGVDIPQLITVNQTSAGTGSSVSSTIVTVGNSSQAAASSFQGAIGRFDYIAATTNTALCRGNSGTISSADEYFIYQQVVLPIWKRQYPPYFMTGTESNNGIQHSIIDFDQRQAGTSQLVQTSRCGGTILTNGRTGTPNGISWSIQRSPIASFAPLVMPTLVRR